jgi:hypothetical protein
LPLAEGLVIQVHSFNVERRIFLGGILVVAIGNYVATRFALAALAVGAVCGVAFLRMAISTEKMSVLKGREANALVALALAAAPWLAWRAPAPHARDQLDRIWFDFRDRFGFVWGSRLRDQFNAAAKNADLPVRLGWRGREPLHGGDARQIDEACALFKALTTRFELINDEAVG